MIPSPELHSLVDQLAIATRKLMNLQEEVAKIPQAQATVDQLRAQLLRSIEKQGFTEEAVDLLLAAR